MRLSPLVLLPLVAMAWACSKSLPASPPPDGFVDVLATISRSCADTANAFECARAVELYRLGKGVAGVTRVGKRLSIAVRNGTVVDLTDSPDPAAEDYVSYAYTEWIGCLGYHLVHRQFVDGESYMLVHAQTGAKLDLPSVPILAPDCGRLAAVGGLPSGASVLQIWRLDENGRAVLEWGHQPDTPWAPGIPAWIDTVRLRLPYETEDDPQTRHTLKVRLYTDGWRIEP